MNRLLNKNFIVVAGKGGVGRTTVTFCIGKWAARQGKKVLICLAHSGSRYRHILENREQSGIHQIEPGLFLLNVDPVAAREEYALKIIRNRLLHRLVFSNRYVNSFLDAVPGLSEWAMLGKATYHALPDAPKHERYDMVLFDSPPTGHGLDILRLPNAIAESVQGGLMRQDALLRVALLKDASKTAVVPVCLPEELPTNETIELTTELRRHGLPLYAIVVNKMLDVLPDGAGDFCDSRCPEMQKMKEAQWAQPALIRRDQRLEQLRHVDRLHSEVPAPLLRLPRLDTASFNNDAINTLTEALTRELQRFQL
ncbi:MAG: ArsA family ATPase [Deltaproteobacteria bacterium]|nr:ArsA family ATPase [Deltaproteobacteria bacterium]